MHSLEKPYHFDKVFLFLNTQPSEIRLLYRTIFPLLSMQFPV